jgi:nitroreductase
MNEQRLTPQLARRLAGAAVTAPSIHNTQPWRFVARPADQVIELSADPGRMLRRTDPAGRAVHISCGAALFNLRLAVSCAAAEPVIRLLPQPSDPQLLAVLRLAGPHQPRPRERDLYAAIWRRHTSRAPLAGPPLSVPALAALSEAAALEGATLFLLDEAAADHVIRQTAAAQQRLRQDPAYLADLRAWVGGRRAADGIPEQALWPLARAGRESQEPFLDEPPPLLHPAQLAGSPQLAVLTTRTRHRADWLRAGQALQRVLLVATLHGIATCPLSQAVDDAEPGYSRGRELDSQHFGGQQPQLVLRLGYGPPGPATPRRPVSDVLRIAGRQPAATAARLLTLGQR